MNKVDRKEPAWIIEHYNVNSEPGKSHLPSKNAFTFIYQQPISATLTALADNADSQLAHWTTAARWTSNHRPANSQLHASDHLAHNHEEVRR